MAKRRSKTAKKPGKMPKKSMKMAATSRKKRISKPGKKAGKAAKKATKRTAKPDWFEAFGVSPAMMARLSSRESIMNALVVMFVVFATLSSGVFFHPTKAPEQAMTVTPMALPHK